MSEETRNFFDDVGQRYGDSFAHDPGLIDFVKSSLQRLEGSTTKHVLDAGCGTGAPVSLMAAQAGCKVTGIDLSPTMARIAAQTVPTGRFEVADMLQYRPEQKQDAVFAMFSHFQLTTAQLRELGRRFAEWITPGGFLFIGTMAADDYPEGSFAPDEPGGGIGQVSVKFMGRVAPGLFLTRAGWNAFLVENGFEVLDTSMMPFQAPEEAQCDLEPHYYLTCQKI